MLTLSEEEQEANCCWSGALHVRGTQASSYTRMRRPSHSLCLAQVMASWRRGYVSSFMTTE